MKKFLIKLNSFFEGFRGLIAIWVPIAGAYVSTFFMNFTSLSKNGITTAAQLAVIPTLKLIWTDAIPKLSTLYKNWLNSK